MVVTIYGHHFWWLPSGGHGFHQLHVLDMIYGAHCLHVIDIIWASKPGRVASEAIVQGQAWRQNGC